MFSRPGIKKFQIETKAVENIRLHSENYASIEKIANMPGQNLRILLNKLENATRFQELLDALEEHGVTGKSSFYASAEIAIKKLFYFAGACFTDEAFQEECQLGLYILRFREEIETLIYEAEIQDRPFKFKMD